MKGQNDEAATSEKDDQPEKIPLSQALLDDIFLLVALGLGIPLILYIVWGIYDLTNVPLFTP